MNSENKLSTETPTMNNNPIKLLFELGNTMLDMIDEYKKRGVILADEEKLSMRMLICADCKCFEKSSTRCSLCGCFMNTKVRFEASSCPIGKW